MSVPPEITAVDVGLNVPLTVIVLYNVILPLQFTVAAGATVRLPNVIALFGLIVANALNWTVLPLPKLSIWFEVNCVAMVTRFPVPVEFIVPEETVNPPLKFQFPPSSEIWPSVSVSAPVNVISLNVGLDLNSPPDQFMAKGEVKVRSPVPTST